MDQHQADEYIAQFKINEIYVNDYSHYQNDPCPGVTLDTDLAKLPNDKLRPVLDQFKANLAIKLHLSLGGIADAINAEKGQINIAPTVKVTAEQLRDAIEQEINAAKARVAAKHVNKTEISGGMEATLANMQAGGRGKSGSELA